MRDKVCISISVFQKIVCVSSWLVRTSSYIIRSRICQISCRNVADKNRWSLKVLWEMWAICDLVKWMSSLVRMRLVFYKGCF